MLLATIRNFLITVLSLCAFIAVAQPVASFTASPTSGCSPLVVNFTNNSTGASSYSWTFGNTNTSVLPNPSTTYTNAGVYTVSLVATNGSASSTYNVQIHVYDPPVVNFTASPTSVCLGKPITFTDASTLNAPGTASYQWNFGNGQSMNGSTVTYTYPAANTYSVTLVVTNSAGCTASHTISSYITVNPPPIASFSASPTLTCTNVPVTFTNSSSGSSGITSNWDFGDGTPHSTASSPTHSYTNPGTYSVTLKIADGLGCKDSVTYTNYITVIAGTVASFTGPSFICAGQSATFTNTSTPGFTACTWDFGNNTSGSGSPATATYPNPGTYIVILTSTNNNCSATATHSIVVNPQPVVNASYSPAHPCPAPALINFTTSTPGTSYTWDFGDGTPVSHVQNPSHTYLSNNSYSVSLIVTNSQGCSDTGDFQNMVVVYPLDYTISDSSGNHCIPFTVCFSDTLQYTPPPPGQTAPYPYYPVVSRTWNFGDGSPTSNLARPCHTYTVYGTYIATCTVTTSNGCTATDTLTIYAGSPDTANFIASPLVACVKENITFTNLSSGATNYVWLYGDGLGDLAGVPNPQMGHKYQYPGIYTVILIAIKNGCRDTMTRTNYITVHNPKSMFGPIYSCTNNYTVSFANTSIGVTSFSWDFGDGTPVNNTAWSPTHVYGANGLYNVILTTHNDTFSCTDTLMRQVLISQPVASITTADTNVCKGTPITLIGHLGGGASPPGPTNHTWTLDNHTFPDTTDTRTYTFNTIGQKLVRLVIDDYRGCKDTAYRTILVAWPAVNFTGSPLSTCINSAVTFIDQSTDAPTTTFTSRFWRFGDGGTQGGNSGGATHSYSNGGTFNVTLIVTDNVGCIDSLVKPAYIQVHKPQASFTVSDTTVCKDAGVQFYNLSQGTGLSYEWHFGDGGTSTAIAPVHAYLSAGVYNVKLVVTDNIGCKDSLTVTNYIDVKDRPIASFNLTSTFSICYPLTDTFTNTSQGAISYTWLFGDGNFSTFTNAVNVYTGPGNFDVQLIATNNFGCKDTAHHAVQILGYSGIMTYAPLTGCAPLTVTFNANIGLVPSFVYDFSDGTTLTTTNTSATHTYLTPGSYVPRLIMNSTAGCQSSSIGNDIIKVDGVFTGFTYTPYPACGSDTLHFTDTSHGAFSTIVSREWIFHDGITNTSTTPSHFYNIGSYNVILTEVTSTGCHDTMQRTVNIFSVPTISACPDTTVCLTDSALLFALGGVSYEWGPAATLSCTACLTPYAVPSVPTTYYVIGTDVNGCKNSDTTLVLLKIKTTGSADSLAELCAHDSLQLHSHADFSGATYTWIPAEGLSDNHIPNPIARPSVTTIYMLIIREGKCIPDTLYTNVIVHPIPDINAGPDQTIIAGNSTIINTTALHVISYLWTPDSTLSCDTCADPTASPKHTTDYLVVVTSDFGCVDSDVVRIDVICDHSQVFIPNTFTPNGDGANDRFYPHGKGLQIIKSFRLYDRWGELIYEKHDFNLNETDKAWDGTFNGQKLTPDVYVYVVDAICDTGAPITWTGAVALIR